MSRHTVIITGGTKGLGLATGLAFARAGHRVIAWYAKDEVAAESARTELLQLCPDSLTLKRDARFENADFWTLPEITSAESLVLINNAWGSVAPRPFHLSPWEDCESALMSGLKAGWECSRAVVRPMAKAGRGAIINVLTTTVHGLPPKGFAAYATAKHALRGLTLSLASEYSARGIRIFSVSPGLMPTALTAGWDPRFMEAARQLGQTSDPSAAGQRILELTNSPETLGRGEDYCV